MEKKKEPEISINNDETRELAMHIDKDEPLTELFLNTDSIADEDEEETDGLEEAP